MKKDVVQKKNDVISAINNGNARYKQLIEIARTKVDDDQVSSFVDGADWMRDQMIKKACDSLYELVPKHCGYYNREDLIKDFRKAMSE